MGSNVIDMQLGSFLDPFPLLPIISCHPSSIIINKHV